MDCAVWKRPCGGLAEDETNARYGAPTGGRRGRAVKVCGGIVGVIQWTSALYVVRPQYEHLEFWDVSDRSTYNRVSEQ